jgi:glycosyltransferase involved in cell wall biosynthesis
MKKVKLIYSKNLSDQTGGSTVIRQFHESKDLFLSRKIDLQVLSRDMLLKSDTIRNMKQSFLNRIKHFLVGTLGKMARTKPLAAYLYMYIRSYRPAKKIIEVLNQYIDDSDILFFHEIDVCYIYLKRYGKGNHKIYLTSHSDGDLYSMLPDLYKNYEKSIFYKKNKNMEKFVLQSIDKIGFVSKTSSEHFIDIHPTYDSKNVYYVSNGMADLGKHHNCHNEKFEIVCVGTVTKRKGQPFILEALISCKISGNLPSNIHFTIVGGGDLLEELRRKTSDNNLDSYITFVGPSNNVDNYLINGDIFILPSLNEGMPMAIIEAMRLSMPIISTAVGGIPEMIDDKKSGLLIEPSTSGVLSFIKSINDYDWVKMGEESYNKYKESFSIEAMMSKYSDILNQDNV